MKKLSFKLSMPHTGSSGGWTSSNKNFYLIRSVPDDVCADIMEGAESEPVYEGMLLRTKVGETPPRKQFSHAFGDGWVARVTVEQVDSREASRRKKNVGRVCRV